MGFRSWANEHPVAMSATAGICLLLLCGGVTAELLANRHAMTTVVPQHYFTVDDGKTFFAGNGVPPFDYQGQTAVRAYVFECGGHRFVGYLERYKPDAHALELAGKATIWIEANGKELKRPGDQAWISSSNVDAVATLINVPCPSGSGDTPTPVEP